MINTSLQLFPKLFEEMGRLGYDPTIKGNNIAVDGQHLRGKDAKNQAG